jgi:hypothetical protein
MVWIFKIYCLDHFQVYNTILVTTALNIPILSLLLVTTILLSFQKFNSIYKWYDAAFVFLLLAYFTLHNVLQFYPCCYKWENFFFFKDEYILLSYISHFYLITSLGPVSNASMNIEVQLLVSAADFIFFWDIYIYLYICIYTCIYIYIFNQK